MVITILSHGKPHMTTLNHQPSASAKNAEWPLDFGNECWARGRWKPSHTWRHAKESYQTTENDGLMVVMGDEWWWVNDSDRWNMAVKGERWWMVVNGRWHLMFKIRSGVQGCFSQYPKWPVMFVAEGDNNEQESWGQKWFGDRWLNVSQRRP